MSQSTTSPLAGKLVTIRNDFHNTEARVRVPENGILSNGQVRRVRKALCGIAECTCGGELSERGRQDVMVDVTWNGDVLVSPRHESY